VVVVVGAVAAVVVVVIVVFISQQDIFLLLMSGLCDLNSFIYETEHHNGIAELLEILGRYDITADIVLVFRLYLYCF